MRAVLVNAVPVEPPTSPEPGWPVPQAVLLDCPADVPTLEWLQSLVGGDIETVLVDQDRCAYVNADGRALGLPVNFAATLMWRIACFAEDLGQVPGDYLVGPMVVTGPLDADGEVTSVDDATSRDVITLVRRLRERLEERARKDVPR